MATRGGRGNEKGEREMRIDTSHGFYRHIVRNQIDRDEYHKMNNSTDQSPSSNLIDKAFDGRRRGPRGGKGDNRSIDKASNGEKKDDVSMVVSGSRQPTALVSQLAGENSEIRTAIRERLKKEQLAKSSSSSSPVLIEKGVDEKGKETVTVTDHPLFRLRLIGFNGETIEKLVYKNDKPARLAKGIAVENSLSDEQCRRLRDIIEDEFTKQMTELCL